MAKLLAGKGDASGARSPATALKPGDIVLVEAGDLIPSDGEVIEGVASVNEAAITGESAPVIRESGGDRSAVTGGTQVISDWIKVRITAAPGLDLPRPHDRAGRRRRAAEDAERDRAQHPARRPDDHLRLRRRDDPELRRLCRRHASRSLVLVALFVDADPDDDRRAAVGDRHRRHGPAGALQRAGHVGPRGRGGGRRRHAAARQDRHDHARQPPGDRVPRRCRASTSASSPMRRSSPRCPTRRRKAARSSCWPRRNTASAAARWRRSTRSFIPFSAQTRISGIDVEGSSIRKGAVDAVLAYVGGDAREPRQCRGRVAEPASTSQRHRRAHRQVRRHAAGGRQGRPAARRHPPEGHRQGRHPRALRGAAPDGHPHRDDHRRQPADRRGDRRRSRASTISSPRRRPRTS